MKLSKAGHPGHLPPGKDEHEKHDTDSLTAPTIAALRDRSRAIRVQVPGHRMRL